MIESNNIIGIYLSKLQVQNGWVQAVLENQQKSLCSSKQCRIQFLPLIIIAV